MPRTEPVGSRDGKTGLGGKAHGGRLDFHNVYLVLDARKLGQVVNAILLVKYHNFWPGAAGRTAGAKKKGQLNCPGLAPFKHLGCRNKRRKVEY